jgi:glycosyltransferase involved in cell wall biosynthesis
MTSSGIRASRLARELGAELLVPGDEARLRDVDLVVAQTLPARAPRPRRVIYDLYIPALTENLAAVSAGTRSRLDATAAVLAQELALATGDAFICATDRQRDFYLGVLADLGRVDPDVLQLIGLVPFGIEPVPPQPRRVLKGVLVEPGDRILLWAGGLSEWLDPETPIRALDRLGRRDVKLVFLGTAPPGGVETAALRRVRELAGPDVIVREGWVPYEERGAFLLEADVGVSAHHDTVEARYAFRTRLLDHVWADLPTVTTAGEAFGDLLAERGLGAAVPARDDDAYADAIARLLDEPPASERFEALRSEYLWPRVVEPLQRLIEEGPHSVATHATGTRVRLLGARAALSGGRRLRTASRQLRRKRPS